MQNGMRTYKPGQRNNPDAGQHIAALLAAWRTAKLPVVHVRHISRDARSVFAPGQDGAAFQRAFAPLPEEHVLEKNVPDAFVHGALERWLHMRAIGHLVIAGVSTNHSVESTARSAGNLGFRSTVLADATYAYAQPDYAGVWRSAQAVHLMSLANLDGDHAAVRTTAQVLAQLLATSC